MLTPALTMKIAHALFARLEQWQAETGATYTSAGTAALLAFFAMSDDERRAWCQRYAAFRKNDLSFEAATRPLTGAERSPSLAGRGQGDGFSLADSRQLTADRCGAPS